MAVKHSILLHFEHPVSIKEYETMLENQKYTSGMQFRFHKLQYDNYFKQQKNTLTITFSDLKTSIDFHVLYFPQESDRIDGVDLMTVNWKDADVYVSEAETIIHFFEQILPFNKSVFAYSPDNDEYVNSQLYAFSKQDNLQPAEDYLTRFREYAEEAVS